MTPERFLPKRLKFRRFEKHEGRNRGLMALSLPTNEFSPTYVNASLAKHFKEKGIRRVFVMTDPENEAIGLQATTDEHGFALIPSSGKGNSIAAKLRTVMPVGRYIYVKEESTKKIMVFKKEHIMYKKRRQDGSD